jgi:hypothetical protein
VNRLDFALNISREQYLHYYRGTARAVIVRTTDGRRVQFPAASLQRFLTHSGISGRFCIKFSDDHKLVDLQKI